VIKNHEKGFTLIELLIAIALIAIVSLVSIPQIKKAKIGYDLSNDMFLMKGTISRAKLEAMKLGTFTSVNFTPGGGGSATYVAFVDTDRDGVLDAGETVIDQGEFHTTSIMSNPSFTTALNGGFSMQFNPLGFPFGLVGGVITDYSGTIDARCTIDSSTVIYQRLTISTGGQLTITKQSTPFT
jgi:prepilin-type N-terminal cleavage/methylation domain-containing protein